MGQKVGKKMNDGNKSELGLKQDRFRNSEFEFEPREVNRFGGVSRSSPNTINGPWAENRGRRGDQIRLDNPFENGELSNWNHRKGWGEGYEFSVQNIRRNGGSLIPQENLGHRGKGPKGYVRADGKIFEEVCEILTRDRDIDASRIEVQVDDGIVTLTGKIEDRNMKRFAGQIVEHVSGVRDIQNLLEFDRR